LPKVSGPQSFRKLMRLPIKKKEPKIVLRKPPKQDFNKILDNLNRKEESLIQAEGEL
jgi:hypothetical protein